MKKLITGIWIGMIAVLGATAQTASVATSVAHVSIPVIQTGRSTLITVQLKDANGTNITTGGATVSFVASPSSGSFSTVNDLGDGRYTVTYTSGSTAETITITPRLGATPVNFTNTVSVRVDTQYLLDGTSGNKSISEITSTTGNIVLGQRFFADYLIVAGGGGGGGDNGGGGGAGGLLQGKTDLTNTNYTITVGSGGAGGGDAKTGTKGGNSSAFSLTATGGGGGSGGSGTAPATTGGSGGGGNGETPSNGANGSPGEGFAGGNGFSGAGGGGGGAGGIGANGESVIANRGGVGGQGRATFISGLTPTYFAGGGGGGPENSINETAAGGIGGGGAGKRGTADNGIANTGGGGGGAGYPTTGTPLGGSGGSGIIIVRYQGPILASAGGNAITSFTGDGINGDDGVTQQVHTFTSSGTFSLSGIDINGRLKTTLPNVIGGTGSLTYNGVGELVLAGNNTYTGNTVITGGTLTINGDQSAATGAVTVGNSASLKGTGTLGGATTIQSGGTLQPGNSIGTLTFSDDLTLESGGHLNWEIDDATGTEGTEWDLLNVTGILTVSSSSAAPFMINLSTLLAGGSAGALTNFNPTGTSIYRWKFLSASSISNFASDKFQIVSTASNGTNGFISAVTQTGTFKVEQTGNTLEIVYYPSNQYTLNGTNNDTDTEALTTVTSTNSLTLGLGVLADYLIVAGGGGGGGDNGGGGGGGGVVTNVGGVPISLNALNYPIVVGAGGAGGAANARGSNGGNSSAFGEIAIGGGGGGAGSGGQTPQTGGSGGGGAAEVAENVTGASGTVNQGNAGGDAGGSSDSFGGGGGGGAGTAGSTGTDGGGAGGNGVENTISGASVFYAGGGGGGPANGINKSANGGTGGGGTGRLGTAGNGSANTGGGGGGAGAPNPGTLQGGTGGSGVVFVRYKSENAFSGAGGTITSFVGDGTIGESGAYYQVHRFNSSGNFNLSSVDLNTQLSAVHNGIIEGSGDLIYTGPGTLTLNGANTYTGTTTISGGTLQVGDGNTTGVISSNNISVGVGATLRFNRSNAYTLSNSNRITGAGTVEKSGDGTLDLGGITNHEAGTWVLNSGTIGNGTLSAGNFSFFEGTVSAVLGGTGTLTKAGDGTATLSGNNTYSGATTVTAGTLVVNGTNSGSGAVTVANEAILKGNGSIAGAVTIQSGGTLQPGNTTGTMSFGSDLTLSGDAHLNWLINNATGTAGTSWSTLAITGALNITATSSSKFNINVWSVLADGTNGEMANFDPTENIYSWTILTTTGGINGFDANNFQINLSPTNGTNGLVSPYKVDGFNIVQDGNQLKLTYSPPAQQTLNGTNNGTELASYTTNTSAGSLTLNLGLFVDYLIVAGGGGGGGDNGGGGGGGGVISSINHEISSSTYAVSVGAGGTGGAINRRGSNGGNSSIFGKTADGGGGGGGGETGQTPQSGGSGGGADGETSSKTGLKGIAGQGTKGGNGSTGGAGGGGGAGGIGLNGNGVNGGAGGPGFTSTITGTATAYAGGGGGASDNGVNFNSAGGTGGGGAGKPGSGDNGIANTGGGGGGGGFNGTNAQGGNGGSGIVIVRYEGESLGNVGGTITSYSGDGTIGNNGVLYQVHTFRSNGNFDLSAVSLANRLRASLSGNISGSGNLIYNGPGVLSLTGTGHTYSGSTTVSAGNLQVNSSITSSSGVTVASGATLSGTGTLPSTTVSGTHAPGTSPGVQTITGDLTYNSSSTFQWELIANDATAADRGTDFDGVDVSGTLNIDPTAISSLVFNAAGSAVDWTDAFWSSSHSWLVFDNAATPTVSGTIFGTINVSTDINGVALNSLVTRDASYFYWSQVGDDLFLNYVAASSLPVTWKSFTGREKNGQVELNWETATEQNTKDFVVEHSGDASRWKAIGTVTAAGNSTSPRSYAFLHTQPGVKNFYRLLQRDLDGKQSYSSIVNVNVAELLNGIRILGNPARNKELVIRLDKSAFITITNQSGQYIYKGLLPMGTHRISMEGRAAGVYWLRSDNHSKPFILE